MNSKKGRRHPVIPDKYYMRLKEHFRQNNTHFFTAIGKDLGWNNYYKDIKHS